MEKKNEQSSFTIGIFMGGKSIEAEVSFNSGRTICDHIDTMIYNVVPLFQTKQGTLYILPWHFLHRGKIKDFEHRLATEAKKINWDDLPDLIDFAYIAQHGRFAEDGILQGTLEVLNIPYLGSKVFASALGMNKILTKQWLQYHNIECPRGVVITPDNHQNALKFCSENLLTFPLIVKPAHEGSSHGVSLATNETELSTALIKAATINVQKKQDVLIEQYETGVEFTCIALEHATGWHALSVTELIKQDQQYIYDYEQKYMPGKAFKKTPARLAPDILDAIEKTCIKTSQVLGFQTISRIDGIYTNDGRIVIIDPNSLSGMAPNAFIFDQAALHGFSHKKLINHLITQELTKQNKTIMINSNETIHMNNRKTKIKIGLMLGGNTHEKEVSFDSGRNAFYKLSPEKYDVTPIFVDQQLHLYKIPETLLIKNSTLEVAEQVTPAMRIAWSSLPEHYNFIFLGLHGGAGENGSFQGFLEMLELPYNGSGVFASALCMDKYKANEWFKAAGIEIPEHRLLDLTVLDNKTIDEQKILVTEQLASLSFPIISKPHNDGCSVLVNKSINIDELINHIPEHRAAGNTHMLCEEQIIGMELTVGVLGNDDPIVFPASHAVTTKSILSMEEKFLPGAGENQTPAPLSTSAALLVSETIKKTYQAAQCAGYARIDCFYQTAEQSPTKKERVVILEVNTLPALTPATCLFHQAAEIGIKPMELIDNIVMLGFEKHRKYAIISMDDKNIMQNI
jgi:UDP-N-acetylmuramate--alanine ligase